MTHDLLEIVPRTFHDGTSGYIWRCECGYGFADRTSEIEAARQHLRHRTFHDKLDGKPVHTCTDTGGGSCFECGVALDPRANMEPEEGRAGG